MATVAANFAAVADTVRGRTGAVIVHLSRVSPDGRWLHALAQSGLPDDLADSYARTSIEVALPTAEAARTGLPQFLRSDEEAVRRWPAVAVTPRLLGDFSAAFLPLRTGRLVLGVLTLVYDDGREFDDALMGRLSRLADWVIDELRPLMPDLTAERPPPMAGPLLRDITLRLVAASTPAEVARSALGLLAEGLDADAGLVVDVQGTPSLVGEHGLDPTWTGGWAEHVLDRLGSPWDVAAASGKAVSVVGRELMRDELDDAHLLISEDLGVESWHLVPLVSDGTVTGILALGCRGRRQLSDHELAVLADAAEVVAVALSRAGAALRGHLEAAEARVAASVTAALFDIATRLSGLHHEGAAAEAVAQAVLALGHAQECGIFVVRDRESVRLARAGQTLPPFPRADRLPVDVASPITHAALENRAMWFEQRAHWGGYPGVEDEWRRAGGPTVGVHPLGVTGQSFGSLYANFAAGHVLTTQEKRLLGALSEMCAQTLARIWADEARTRMRAVLTTSEQRLQRLVDSGVLGIIRANDQVIHEANDAFLRMLGYGELPANGIPWSDITPEEWAEADAAALASLLSSGVARPYEKEYVAVGGRRVPVLIAAAAVVRSPLDAMVTVVDLSVQKQAQAAEQEARRATLSVVEALQAQLLPTVRTADHPSKVDVVYRPGDNRLMLGGDFYDVTVDVEGDLAVLIGDVSGHGPEAAGLGAALRLAWRGALRAAVDREQVLSLLNTVLLDERKSPDLFATVCCAWVPPTRAHVRLLLAGHHPPLLRHRDGTTEMLGDVRHAPLLGVFPISRTPLIRIPFSPASRLLLCTDGLFEGYAAADRNERLGLDGLLALLEREPRLWEEPNALVEQCMRLHGGGLPDDVALVLLH